MCLYRILVVDDEEDLCEVIRFALETKGYAVDVAYSAEEALMKNLHEYHLLLLDIMMGEISGFKLARIIRSNPKTATTPIVFLSAKDTENDRLTAFNVGADDYITKPFSLREMAARIHAIISRVEQTKLAQPLLLFDKLKIDLSKKQVSIEEQEIQFTKKEFELLKLFMENKNRLFSREELLKRIWPDESFVLARTIDVNITRIRKKIGPYEKNIVTKLGLGYYFEG